ncbi:FAD-dependent oxidoreductase [Thalassovita taeanensis]|uniref:FAD-dependent oxidoreductase n=1 Tax=Thalassovita taeanensis TaxID=657014 RepID=UPI001587175E|nr:FAD-binding oxidoreductase [Thalassovita taeanensis]
MDPKVFDTLNVSLEATKAAQTGLQGYIVLPGMPDYNEDRKIFNPIFDSYPVMIIYCEVESDVAIALDYATTCGLLFCLRSGGHCTAGFSTGPGVLIDVKSLDSVHIDPLVKTATVGCGVDFGSFNKTLNQYGLHVPGGECPDVCIGGYVQGGGYGFTSVKYGMNCDNVLSMRVMLADGSIVTASKQQNVDLMWAMLGGTGGNFGVLLSVTYQLHDLDTAYGWALIWKLDTPDDIQKAADAMMLLQSDYMLSGNCDPNMTIQVSLCFQSQIYVDQPPPPNTPLTPFFMVRGLYVGSSEDGAQAIAPLQALPGCITQWTKTARYIVLNDELLNVPQSMPMLDQIPFEDKASRYVEAMLTNADWYELIAYFTLAPVNMAYMYLEFYGGAINSVPTYDTAFVHRNAAYDAVMDVYWVDSDDQAKCEAFLDGWKALMEPHWNGEIYQNYASLSAPDYTVNYWGGAVPFLSLIKTKYDPNNVFTFAQQVPQVSVLGDAAPDLSDFPEHLVKAARGDINFAGGVMGANASLLASKSAD